MDDHRISVAAIKRGRRAFKRNEPRDLFYRAATELVRRSLLRRGPFTLAESVAVLLQTWNSAYYRYRGFDDNHFVRIERLLRRYHPDLMRLRNTRIEGLKPTMEPRVLRLFLAFETELGPVGAAKVLHVLAPHFFPLWDRRIAREYGLALGRVRENGGRYWRFMLETQTQVLRLRRSGQRQHDLVKAIDEYNYSRYTRGWLTS